MQRLLAAVVCWRSGFRTRPWGYEVGGIITKASVTLFAGFSSSLKSWLALEMALAKASGRPWLGHADFATERGAVTYLDREAGLYEVRRRLHAIRAPLGVIEDPLLDVCAFPKGNVFDPEFRKRLIDLASTRSMVVIDTLAAFSFGVDENSAAMAEGVGLFAEIASLTKATFVVVAHEKKKGKDGNEIDPRERVRGSSAIFGAVDAVFSLQRDKPREPVEVSQTKARNGREADSFLVRMVDVPGGGVSFEVIPKVATRAATPTEKFAALCASILDCVRENPDVSGRKVRELVVGRDNAINAAVDELIERGLLQNLGTKNEKRLRVVARGAR